MATKSKLEKAVAKHAESLNDAQKELVMAQLSDYRRNRIRMSDISDIICSLNSRTATTREDLRFKQAERSALTYEYNQLAMANSRISSDLFALLEDKE